MTDNAHPLLPAATPVLLGEAGTVQIGGVDSTDGLVLDPPPGLASLLRGLDGRRTQRAVRADAVRDGLDPDVVDAALEALRDTGLLTDLDAADLLATGAGPAAVARAAVELPAVAGTRTGDRPAGWRARRQATVAVEGATRVGTPLAAVLAASGIGRLVVRDPGVVGAADTVVGGLTAADEGRPRAAAAADAIRRVSPLTDLGPLPAGRTPDLTVFTRAWAASDPLLPGTEQAHLVATVRGETGVVGPLVVPGATSCLRCADRHRRDADARWPRLAAQLTATEPPASGATITCLLTALVAAGQVLAYLDGADAPITLEGTVELRPPDLLPRLRRWARHPDCDCAVADDDEAAPPPREPTSSRRGSVAAGHNGPLSELPAHRDDTAPPRPGAGEEDA